VHKKNRHINNKCTCLPRNVNKSYWNCIFINFCQDILSFVIHVYKIIFQILITTCISVSIDKHMQTIKLATINFTSHVHFSLFMAEICKKIFGKLMW